MSWPDGGITPFRGEKATNWEGGYRGNKTTKVSVYGSGISRICVYRNCSSYAPTHSSAAMS